VEKMRSNVAHGLVFALLPTLLFTAPAIGDESSSAQVLSSASSSELITPSANLNAEPGDLTGATEPGPVVAEQLPAPALMISADVMGSSRLSAFMIASAANTLRLVEKAKSPSGARSVGKDMAKAKYGWGAAQYSCLNRLWTRESMWNYRSRNKRTGAHGIPQAYPASKYETIGSDWRTNPITQMTWGLKYIKVRYQTPCNALNTFYRKNWY